MTEDELLRWARAHGVTGPALEALQDQMFGEVLPAESAWVARFAASGVAMDFSETTASPELKAAGDHLELHERLGAGGMGEVYAAVDGRLDRRVALKLLHPRHAEDARLAGAFVAEARAQALLVHPGVLPVYEIGTWKDGRPYFTMALQQGRTLGRVFRDARDDPATWTRRRLVELIRRGAEVVAFAHDRGLLHCDLKPENLMVGDFGDVVVVDWGLQRADDGVQVSLSGTPGYMAPEQARGEPLDRRADVFGLGAILYEACTGEALFAGGTSASVLAAVAGFAGIEPPPDLPTQLAQVLVNALSPDPERRPANAGELAAELGSWLDGARRRARALAFLERARKLRVQSAEVRERGRAHRARADVLAKQVHPSAPLSEKAELWQEQDAAAACEERAEEATRERIELLLQALSHDAELAEAITELAAWYRARVVAAEAMGDHAEAAAAEARLRFFDRGEHSAFLVGDGCVTLHTDPPGAEVRLHRYETVDRRRIPQFERVLGTTPLDRVSVPRGSYLLTVTAPGRKVVRYPVWIGRQEHWHGVPPNEQAPRAIALPPRDLDPSLCWVPGGWFQFGTDVSPHDTWPASRRWEDGFAIQRHPVTNADYIRFLDDLSDRGREEEVRRCVPRAQRAQGDEEVVPIYARDAQGHHHLVPDGDGDLWLPEWPVIQIPWAAACAYAAWMTERTGQNWSLPTESQWEKAARGVDGRTYPWGEGFDATFALIYDSFPDRPNLAPVTDFPLDESPYGVRWMAGGVREWCLPRFARPGQEVPPLDSVGDRLLRGGCWHFGKLIAQTTVRSRLFEGRVSDLAGFRLVCTSLG